MRIVVVHDVAVVVWAAETAWLWGKSPLGVSLDAAHVMLIDDDDEDEDEDEHDDEDEDEDEGEGDEDEEDEDKDKDDASRMPPVSM